VPPASKAEAKREAHESARRLLLNNLDNDNEFGPSHQASLGQGSSRRGDDVQGRSPMPKDDGDRDNKDYTVFYRRLGC
jgi:hypothetical protein